MKPDATRTPGPWSVEGPDPFGDWNLLPPEDHSSLAIAAIVNNLRPAEETEANAQFIVTACNAYDEMRTALEDLLLLCENSSFENGVTDSAGRDEGDTLAGQMIDRARAALKEPK